MFEELAIQNALVRQLSENHDERGSLIEVFRSDWNVNLLGWADFRIIQQNYVLSRKGALRGIHFSNHVSGQRKILYCLEGEILDQLVDFRVNSPTYLKKVSILVSDSEPKLILIPAGVGHSFQTLSENSRVIYFFDLPYSPKNEVSINPLDISLNLKWENPAYLSEKDRTAQTWDSYLKTSDITEFES
jgi:dTDP-4-dehydrorhamnose 3,5-epimerase